RGGVGIPRPVVAPPHGCGIRVDDRAVDRVLFVAAVLRARVARRLRQRMSSGIADPDIDQLVDSLTLEEQVSLLAGADFWHTVPIEHAGIPVMRVSDGPAGARGTLFEGGPASVNVPC